MFGGDRKVGVRWGKVGESEGALHQATGAGLLVGRLLQLLPAVRLPNGQGILLFQQIAAALDDRNENAQPCFPQTVTCQSLLPQRKTRAAEVQEATCSRPPGTGLPLFSWMAPSPEPRWVHGFIYQHFPKNTDYERVLKPAIIRKTTF